MAQKSKQNQPGQRAGIEPEGSPQGSEFENAVTTEISGVLASAFGEDCATEPNDVHVTDIELTAHLDPAADDALSPGIILNERFEIIQLVHSGGMSLVYKAVDHRRRPEGSGEIHVAIKMMRPSIASDNEARLSLEREAAKAQSLSHPNIINIFDFDDHEGRFFLVMEWLEGESVNTMLRRTRGERIESGLAWRVIEGAAASVQHAHQKNIVHADINPSNIFITEKGEIKLLDFGVARYASNAELPEDDRFAWVTKTYASPEVLSGATPVFEDDVFSLACVAYRLLGGKHPFGGRLSLVAKHQGRSVERIPGLLENEWRILQRALAYERSDRPDTVGDFVTQGAKALGRHKSRGRQRKRSASLLRMSLIAAALFIVATGLWLLQRGSEEETGPAVEPALKGVPVATEPVDAPAVSVTEALLTAATQALGAGHLVTPDDPNARALFREALALEPDNPEALRGLRTISNDFVQQAHLALNANDARKAYAALSVAAETDPANPAIEIVNQLLATKANGEMADARLAVATGNFDLAEERLTLAEQYRNIDPDEVRSIRRQIEQSRQSGQLLEDLAVADAHIAAGRLLLPEGDNAHALLLDLYGQYGEDVRLILSMERLGERLLTRAAFAAAADRVADATELLDAVDALGVLVPEVETARMSLETIESAPETEDVQAPPHVAEERTGAAPETEDAQRPQVANERTDVVAETEDALPPLVAEAQSDDEIPAASAGEQAVLEEPGPQAAMTSTEPEPRRQSLQELGITEYVAPRFPGYAQRRGISGTVEVGFIINADGNTDSVQVVDSQPGRVFAKSAAEAVRQWRFRPRDEAIKAQVTLRFDFAP